MSRSEAVSHPIRKVRQIYPREIVRRIQSGTDSGKHSQRSSLAAEAVPDGQKGNNTLLQRKKRSKASLREENGGHSALPSPIPHPPLQLTHRHWHIRGTRDICGHDNPALKIKNTDQGTSNSKYQTCRSVSSHASTVKSQFLIQSLCTVNKMLCHELTIWGLEQKITKYRDWTWEELQNTHLSIINNLS